MSRGRAKLTDKEEKILMMSQLMGLTPSSMVKIGNRLKALENEAREIANINEAVAGFTWENLGNGNWKITDPESRVIEAIRKERGKSRWDSFSWEFDLKVSKPGTRFKPRMFKKQSVRCEYDWKKRLMPGNSKELYAIIRSLKYIDWTQAVELKEEK
jgi:hypothetical protein